MIKYVSSKGCYKREETDNDVHAARVESLCRYANRLQGTNPVMGEELIKKTVFESFPVPWQDSYRMSRSVLANDTITQLVEHMNLCHAVDKSRSERKRKHDDEGSTDDGSEANEHDDEGSEDEGSEEKERNGWQNKTAESAPSDSDTSDDTDKSETEDQDDTDAGDDRKQPSRPNKGDLCPIHGGHRWGNCSLNPKSVNYFPRFEGSNNPHYHNNSQSGNGGRGNGGQGPNNSSNTHNEQNYYTIRCRADFRRSCRPGRADHTAMNSKQ